MFIAAFTDEGVGHSPFIRSESSMAVMHVGHVLPSNHNSSTVLVHVLHCSYAMKRKPRLHHGTVTIDLDKNRLVESPRSSRSHQMTDSQGFC